MGVKTNIQWTDATWNPVIGCTKVSDGCKNCYASNMASRFSGKGQPMEGTAIRGNWTGRILLKPETLDIPLHWRKPRRIFVCSMADLFHADVPDEYIDRVLAVTQMCPQHTFQICTKRPERMHEYFTAEMEPDAGWLPGSKARFAIEDAIACEEDAFGAWLPDTQWDAIGAAADHTELPLRNVWLGVSIEDQATADRRIPWLLKTPAAVRFVSYEPALGPVSFDVRWLEDQCDQCSRTIPRNLAGCYNPWTGDDDCDGSPVGNPLIDWVIAGGESGPNARPAHPDWFRSVRDQCAEAGVPFYFKQWGGWASFWQVPDNNDFGHPSEYPTTRVDGKTVYRVGKRAGCLLDDVEHKEFPRAQS